MASEADIKNLKVTYPYLWAMFQRQLLPFEGKDIIWSAEILFCEVVELRKQGFEYKIEVREKEEPIKEKITVENPLYIYNFGPDNCFSPSEPEYIVEERVVGWKTIRVLAVSKK